MKAESIVVSPCSNPEMDLDTVLAAYSEIGYHNFEAFTSWTKSTFDFHRDPGSYLDKGRDHGIKFTSLHLPRVDGGNLEETLSEAVLAAAFASATGAEVVLYKALDRPTYIGAAPVFLDAIEDFGVVPVIQNHCGSPLTTLDDVREVLEGMNDNRMKTLLEVGHFHSAGVSWPEACELLGDSIALVHIKDQIGKQSVPFGTGEIDLPGLFDFLDSMDYSGKIVVEMEVEDRENTLKYLRDALDYVLEFCEKESQ